MSALAITPGLITHATAVATANGAIAQSAVTGGSGSYTSYSWTSSSGATAIAAPVSLAAALAAKSSLLPGRYTLTIADSASATASYVYDVSYVSPIAVGNIVQLASGEAAMYDQFGYSTAVDGQFMVVGAYNKTQTQTGAGAAYIFRRTDTSTTGTYAFEQKLYSGTTGTNYNFGQSVDIDGDTVVVGEPYGSGRGRVYVWFRTAGTATWTQQGLTVPSAPLVPNDPTGGDNFGTSVAIDGDYIAVGAPYWDQKTPTSILNCGAAYVFLRTGTAWAQQTPQLLAGDPTASDQMGSSIAISGSTVVVGANGWDQKTPSLIDGCGAAYVFTRSGTTWSQQTRLTAAGDLSASDRFGQSVSISGDYIAVGASSWDWKSPAVADCGCVYVFFRNGTTWTQQQRLSGGDAGVSGSMGYSVSLCNAYLLTGAYGWSSGAGTAYLYERSGASWSLVKKLTASDAASSDLLGYSVDLSDRYVVCGAFGWEGALADQGAAYTTVLPVVVFTVTPGAITRGNFGSVNTCAIGAPAVTGGSGSYTYSWSSGQTTAAISGISPGTYVLTTTDTVSGDYAVTSYVVTNYAQITVTPGLITHATGPTSATGAIALSAVAGGGTGSYTSYAWTDRSGTPATSTPTTLAAKSALLPGQYTLTITDTNGGTGSYVYDVSYVSPIATGNIVRLTGGEPAASDNFGYSTAVDGQFMVVGAPNKTLNQAGAGVAYIFRRSDTSATGTYAFEFRLVSDITGASYSFGGAVAISGDTVVVGEQGGGTSGSGKVYVWFRTAGTTTWTKQGPLVPLDPTGGDNFGSSVAIDGDYIAVGAPFWDQKTPTSILNCGAAYVFFRTGTTWSQQTPKLLAGDPTASDQLGISIDISGSTVVVGANAWDRKTPSSIDACGAAYVFTRSGTTWSQQTQLTATDPGVLDQFGRSVSISGDYIAVGALTWDFKAPAISDCGCVYVFVRDGTTWAQQAQLTAGDPTATASMGNSVSICNEYLIAGASGRSSGTGAAYLYKRSEATWYLTQLLTASDAASSDYFGCSVDVSDKLFACGAYTWEGSFTDQGAVYSTVLPQNPVISYTGGSITNVAVNGAATGQISALVVAGGSGTGYTFSWSGPYAVPSPTANGAKTGLRAGTYSCLIGDSVGATLTASFVITENSVLSYTGGTITPVAVNGAATGAIGAVTVTGGSGSYVSYTWTGPTTGLAANTQAHTSLEAGTYTLVATDTVGGTGTFAFVVTENPVISYTGGSITNVAVNGGATGQISALVVAGGSGTGYTFSWSGSYSVPSPTVNSAKTGLRAGSYSCLIGDSVGATLTASFVINENTVLSYTGGAITPVAVNGAATGQISALVVAGGSGTGYTFSWSGSYSVPNSTVNSAKTGLRAGSYSCLIGDSVGATLTASFVINENTVLSYTGGAITPVAVNGAATGQISALVVAGGSGTGYTFSWSGSYSVPNSTVNSAKTGLRAGSYSCLIGDSVGAARTASFVMTENAVLSYTGGAITHVSVNGQATGAIGQVTAVGGTGSYVSYSWSSSGGATTGLSADSNAHTGLKAGTYTLLVTDTGGGTGSFAFIVDQNPVLSYTGGAITDVLVNGRATGAIGAVTIIGGSGSYVSYSWSSSEGGTTGLAADSNAHTGLRAGTYILLVEDTVGGTGAFEFVVTQPTVLALTGGAITPVAVSGAATGVIGAVTVTGGSGDYVTYSWTGSAGATTGLGADAAAHTNLKAGTYTVVVTDSAGGTVTREFIVTQNPILSYSGGTVTHAAAAGEASGSISAVTAAGGTGSGFTYSWSPGVSGRSDGTAKTGLPAGLYTCDIGDDAGALLTLSFEIGEPLAVTVDSAVNQTRTADGSVSVLVTGGLSSKSYAWTRDGEAFAGAGGPSLSGLTNGLYECAVSSGPFRSTAAALVITAFLGVTTGPRALRIEWTPIPGALAYAVEFRGGGGAFQNLPLRTVVPFAVLSGLDPSTEYDLRVSATTGRTASSRLYYTDTASTTATLTQEFSPLALQVSVQTVAGPTAEDGSFSLRKVAVLYLPRDAMTAPPRDVNLTLLNGSSVSVSYDAQDESVSVAGTRYGVGDTIDLQGQKVLVRVKI